MPFFCKTVKNEQDRVEYCIQCTVSHILLWCRD